MEWQNAVLNLIQKNQTNIFKIESIKLWLNSYQQAYEELYKKEKSKFWFELKPGEWVRLPPLTPKNKKTKFLRIYEALKEILEFHENEEYFQKEMLSYYEMKDSNSSLKKWVSKNEKIGSEKYSTFLLDYLDYEDNPNHLKISILGFDEEIVYVNRTDFRYTLQFITVFNQVYW